MTSRMRELVSEIVRLQTELDREIERRRRELGWSIKGRLVRFEEGIVAQQRHFRIGVTDLVRRASLGTIMTAPIIYSMIVPLALLDLWATIFQAICFRVYNIPKVRRADYIALDRGRLAYLNWIEALNCVYCGYGNGVVAYAREISSRTEQYWCPIKHAVRITDPHQRYYDFLEYGDAEGYRARLDSLRAALREEAAESISQKENADTGPSSA
ncbi:hypothetical protein [Sphingopyxis terrae]|uniref:Uncharacterized protein n=1 Tax=Sphingopyxis terrae subsp. ummariensis TaxID=429001 RepID=A0A1Y6G065_9SPHN|nr:hypothetical protein CPA46_17240 [Sphingopyxis terrae subsp. ummariensis]SMQ79526.1 hypothetical protein SAMN06295984_3405 [Sphingopyxis terrae subsp. ummariensis]